MAVEPVHEDEPDEGLFVKRKSYCCLAWSSGLDGLPGIEFPASQDSYELHPTFDFSFDEWDHPDCDENSQSFVQQED